MADTIFKDKTLLITGGTGSFGHTVLKHFLTTDIGEIRIFSRDEKKQDDMRHELQANYPDYYNKVKFYIGDVRNIQSLRDVMPGVNFIFHAAALKQVPSCEFFPMEAVGLAGDALESAFDFMENAFADGQEMVVFVNELALGPDSAAYLADNECERFETYSKRLLLHSGQDDILAELQRDDIRQGEHSMEF